MILSTSGVQKETEAMGFKLTWFPRNPARSCYVFGFLEWRQHSRPELSHHPMCESGDWRIKQRRREKRLWLTTYCMPSSVFSASHIFMDSSPEPSGYDYFLLSYEIKYKPKKVRFPPNHISVVDRIPPELALHETCSFPKHLTVMKALEPGVVLTYFLPWKIRACHTPPQRVIWEKKSLMRGSYKKQHVWKMLRMYLVRKKPPINVHYYYHRTISWSIMAQKEPAPVVY